MDDESGDERDRRIGDAETVRAGFDELPVPVVLLEGPQHRLVGMNAAYRAVSGRRDVIGRTIREVFPEVTSQQLFDVVEEVYAGGEPVHAREWRIEFDPGDGEPRVFYLDFDVLPRRRGDGIVHGVLIQQTDVTGRVLQRRRSEAATDAAERRYEAAHQVVVELQQALLPDRVPVLPRVDLAARYLVAGTEQSAGGDWFDVRTLPDNRVGLVVGDVVGHGVTAAAVMSQLRAVLADALDATADPVAAVRRLERFAATVPAARSATVVVAVLDPATGTLDYLTRGHPAPLLVDAEGVARYLLGGDGGPLGSDPGGPARRATVGDGELVVLFSDGLVERPGRPHTEGFDELARITEAAVTGRLWPTSTGPVATGRPDEAPGPRAGATSAAERVCSDAVEMLTRRGYDDDVTVLAAARRRPVEAFDVHTTATAGDLAELRHRLADWLDALRVEPAEQLTLQIAVGEAVDNAAEHGLHRDPEGALSVHIGLTGDGHAHVRVHDDGTWRTPTRIARATSDPDTIDTADGGRGRGLMVLGSVGEDLYIDTRNGTTVTFHRAVHRRTTTDPLPAARPAPTRPGPAGLTSHADDDPPTLTVRGPIDVTNVDELRRELARLSRGATTALTVDLSAVTHLTSVGVAALADILRDTETAGTSATLLAPTGTPAAFVLDLVGLPRHQPAAGPGRT